MKRLLLAAIILASSFTLEGCGNPAPLEKRGIDAGAFEFSERAAASNPYTGWTVGTSKGRFATYTSLHATAGQPVRLIELNPYQGEASSIEILSTGSADVLIAATLSFHP